MIEYFFEDITQPSELDTATTSQWIEQTIQSENYTLNHLNYIFCSDEYLYQINVDYLDHDYYTDIITFDNSESPNKIEGDLFISIDRIRDNAVQLNTSFDSELKRVIIHGLLHLLGYNDKSEDQQKEMRLKEDEYIQKHP